MKPPSALFPAIGSPPWRGSCGYTRVCARAHTHWQCWAPDTSCPLLSHVLRVSRGRDARSLSGRAWGSTTLAGTASPNQACHRTSGISHVRCRSPEVTRTSTVCRGAPPAGGLRWLNDNGRLQMLHSQVYVRPLSRVTTGPRPQSPPCLTPVLCEPRALHPRESKTLCPAPATWSPSSPSRALSADPWTCHLCQSNPHLLPDKQDSSSGQRGTRAKPIGGSLLPSLPWRCWPAEQQLLHVRGHPEPGPRALPSLQLARRAAPHTQPSTRRMPARAPSPWQCRSSCPRLLPGPCGRAALTGPFPLLWRQTGAQPVGRLALLCTRNTWWYFYPQICQFFNSSLCRLIVLRKADLHSSDVFPSNKTCLVFSSIYGFVFHT